MAGEVEKDALLVEGAKSYPQAQLAVATFCQQVQQICREALKRHIPELEEALGLPLQNAEPKAWADPQSLSSDEIDGSWACLGARIVCPTKVKCDLWNYVWWQGRDLDARVSIQFADSTTAERTLAALRKLGIQTVDTYDGEIYRQRALQPAELPGLAAILDDLNRGWIELWRKAGGVKPFLGKR